MSAAETTTPCLQKCQHRREVLSATAPIICILKENILFKKHVYASVITSRSVRAVIQAPGAVPSNVYPRP